MSGQTNAWQMHDRHDGANKAGSNISGKINELFKSYKSLQIELDNLQREINDKLKEEKMKVSRLNRLDEENQVIMNKFCQIKKEHQQLLECNNSVQLQISKEKSRKVSSYLRLVETEG